MSFVSKLREYFHVEYQPGERKLVRKIDFFILTFCCLSYFMNYVSIAPVAHDRLFVRKSQVGCENHANTARYTVRDDSLTVQI